MPTLLDTNCILRYLLADVPDQADLVAERIREGAVVSPEFLSEAVYVLSGKVYGFARDEVSLSLEAFLQDVECEHMAAMREALRIYRDSSLDFPDCILIARHEVEGVPVMTFDKRLKDTMADLPSNRAGR